jgi:hypothetical protein
MKIVIAGSSGRMGRLLIEAVLASGDLQLHGALDVAGSPALDQDAGALLGRPTGVAIRADLDDALRGADVLIYDSTYSDEQFVAGRGHSTWQEGMRIADAAGVATFVAFHHDPEHNDAFMDDVACALSEARPGSLVAREGLFIQI